MKDPRNIAVIGVTGYTGFELATLLLRHPAVPVPTFYVRETNGHHCVSQLFPQLRGRAEAPLVPLSLEAVTASSAGTGFLATAETFSSWYKLPAPHAARLGQAAYGLPELYADKIRSARLVANPGCYATSVILALRPLSQAGLVAPGQNVICDCKSGATGAGKEPRRDLHFAEVDENFRAYNLFSHRHTPEILEHTGLAESQLVFTTHLLPLARGILSTIYVTLSERRSSQDIEKLYGGFYAGRRFVRIWPAQALPELQHVANTNFCDIGFALDASGKRLIVVSCLDNLGKGAAGQAVQNLNLILGMEEQTGLI